MGRCNAEKFPTPPLLLGFILLVDNTFAWCILRKMMFFFCCFVIPMFHCLPAQFCADTLTNRSSRTRMQSGVDFFPDNYRKIFWKKYFWMLLDWLLILEKRVSQKCLQYFRNNFRRNNLQINSHRNARHFPTIRMHHIFHVASALHQTRALVAHFLLL